MGWIKTRLTEKKILRWARRHFRKMGRWPKSVSGPVIGEPGENWQNIDQALRVGRRDLPGGSSLARLLAAQGLRRNVRALPALTIGQILDWAEAFRKINGRWPGAASGSLGLPEGETWNAISQSLERGRRNLPGGFSLARLIRLYENVRLRAGEEMPLSDGHVWGGTPVQVTERIVGRKSFTPQNKLLS